MTKKEIRVMKHTHITFRLNRMTKKALQNLANQRKQTLTDLITELALAELKKTGVSIEELVKIV